MGRRRIRATDVKEILVQRNAGASINGIVHSLGSSRPTVRNAELVCDLPRAADPLLKGYVRILAEWHNLYRGVGLDGEVLDSWLSATRGRASGGGVLPTKHRIERLCP